MPYKDPEDKKRYSKKYRSNPEVKAKYAENNKRWREENIQRIAQRGAERRLKKRAMCMVATARTRAKRRCLPFDLDTYVGELQSIIDSGVCQFSGLPFDLSPGLKYNSPSIDRIYPEKGYVFGNVRIILHCFNCAFGDWGEEVFLRAMPSSRK